MKEFDDRSARASRHPQNRGGERDFAKQRKRLIKLIVCLAAVLVVIVVACIFMFSGSRINSELIGKWRYNEFVAYEFYDDGKGCLCLDDVHYEYTFKTTFNKLTLDFSEDVVRDCAYTFSVDGDELTIVGGKGTDNGTYSLKREK